MRSSIILVFLFSMQCLAASYAQEVELDSIHVRQVDSLKDNRRLVDSLMIDRLTRQIDDLMRDNKTNTENINMLLASKDLDARNRYGIVRQNLENSIDTYRILNARINNLKSHNSARLFESLVNELNNPESNKLGFRLDEKIVSLVQENIRPKRKNVANKIHEAVNHIAKSPILGAIPVISPAANLTSSVMGFLRSTSVVTDGIEQSTITDLESQLSGYIRYYNLMNEANTEFKYNLNIQKQEIGVLQQSLLEQIGFFAQSVGYMMPLKPDREELGAYLNRVFAAFNRAYVTNVFAELERAHTTGGRINYDQILLSAQGNQLKDVNNKLEEFIGLINQFEFQYNTHFRYNSLYAEKMKTALDEAVKMGITQVTLVEDIKTEFEQLQNRTDVDFRTSIHIDELLQAKQSIRYTARVI